MRIVRNRRALLLLVTWLCCCQAWAQSPEAVDPNEPAEYGALIEQALREYEARHFEEARAVLIKAHGIYPNARTFRGVGMVEFELRNYGESIRCLEAALTHPVKPLDPELRRETETLLARARGFVAWIELEVNPGPARVLVDGMPVEVGPSRALALQIGEHTIEVQAPGYQEERRLVNVRGGEQQRLVVELHQKNGVRQDSDESKASRRLWSNPWLWTGVGIVVAGGVTTALLLTRKPEPNEPVRGDVGGVVKALSW